MTDLELVKKCAEKMGYRVGSPAFKVVAFDVSPHAIIASNESGGESVYDPLNNDAQAMALVKKLELSIDAPQGDGVWGVTDYETGAYGDNESLNRAIVRCVAGMP